MERSFMVFCAGIAVAILSAIWIVIILAQPPETTSVDMAIPAALLVGGVVVSISATIYKIWRLRK